MFKKSDSVILVKEKLEQKDIEHIKHVWSKSRMWGRLEAKVLSGNRYDINDNKSHSGYFLWKKKF